MRRQGDDSNGQWQGAAAQSAVAGNQSLVDLKAVFVECYTPDSVFYGEIYWSEGRLTARELPYDVNFAEELH